MLFKLNRTAAAVALGLVASSSAYAAGYEVWVSDQTNSTGVSFASVACTATTKVITEGGLCYSVGGSGGNIHIYSGSDLDDGTPDTATPTTIGVHNLWTNASTETGSSPTRLHGMLPDPAHKYMNVNFVGSGHLAILDVSKTNSTTCTATDNSCVVALFRSTGTPNGRQNHMSFWSPDGSKLMVANQGGRMLERVDLTRDSTNAITGASWNRDATLDLVGGTAATRATTTAVAATSFPTGSVGGAYATAETGGGFSTSTGLNAKQDATLRPTNTVICPIAASNNQHAFVTLGGGGMFVVDYTQTPMKIVAEYSKAKVRAAGCGGMEGGGNVHLNTGTAASGDSEFSVYRLRLSDFDGLTSHVGLANFPKPKVIFADPGNGNNGSSDGGNPNNATQSLRNRDAHGMAKSGAVRYLHQFDRVRNNVEVFDMASLAQTSYNLQGSGMCGSVPGTAGSQDGNLTSDDPAPDLVSLSPLNDKLYVALRGPVPLTISHAANGSCPGLGVIQLSNGGKTGTLVGVLETSNLQTNGLDGLSYELSDPHAAITVLK